MIWDEFVNEIYDVGFSTFFAHQVFLGPDVENGFLIGIKDQDFWLV